MIIHKLTRDGEILTVSEAGMSLRDVNGVEKLPVMSVTPVSDIAMTSIILDATLAGWQPVQDETEADVRDAITSYFTPDQPTAG